VSSNGQCNFSQFINNTLLVHVFISHVMLSNWEWWRQIRNEWTPWSRSTFSIHPHEGIYLYRVYRSVHLVNASSGGIRRVRVRTRGFLSQRSLRRGHKRPHTSALCVHTSHCVSLSLSSVDELRSLDVGSFCPLPRSLLGPLALFPSSHPPFCSSLKVFLFAHSL